MSEITDLTKYRQAKYEREHSPTILSPIHNELGMMQAELDIMTSALDSWYGKDR